MTQYAGLCIGGPLAGQSFVHPKQHIEVPQRGAEPTSYTWHHLGPFAIWIHSSTDFNHALNDMAVAYSEKHHAARRT